MGIKASSIAFYVAAATLLGSCTYSMSTIYVRPWEKGILQVEMSLLGETGIQNKEYTTGYHIVIPGLEKMHKFPKDVQVLNLNKAIIRQRDNPDIRDASAATINTSDGFYVNLDVSIIYHIEKPFDTISKVGAGRLYQDNGIIPRAEPALKETFGQLEPEDFFNVEKRVAKQESAKERLNDVLSETGIVVDHVFVRYPTFHSEIQKKFENKVTQDQLVETNKSKASVSGEKAELERLVTMGVQAATTKRSVGTAYQDSVAGATQAYVKARDSEGQKLIDLAQAEKKRLINEAYEGEGSDLLVGLKMAENMQNLQAIIVSAGGKDGFNPLDLSATVDKISGGGK